MQPTWEWHDFMHAMKANHQFRGEIAELQDRAADAPPAIAIAVGESPLEDSRHGRHEVQYEVHDGTLALVHDEIVSPATRAWLGSRTALEAVQSLLDLAARIEAIVDLQSHWIDVTIGFNFSRSGGPDARDPQALWHRLRSRGRRGSGHERKDAAPRRDLRQNSRPRRRARLWTRSCCRFASTPDPLAC